jgi:hypothetical protein
LGVGWPELDVISAQCQQAAIFSGDFELDPARMNALNLSDIFRDEVHSMQPINDRSSAATTDFGVARHASAIGKVQIVNFEDGGCRLERKHWLLEMPHELDGGA